MTYLEKFLLPDEEKHWSAIANLVNFSTPDEYYPCGLFSQKRLSRVDFEDITVFYGGNGSGKTTLLNLIAENLGLPRKTVFHATEGFSGYVSMCESFLGKDGKGREIPLPEDSAILASDDIFDGLIETRKHNLGITKAKSEAREVYSDYKHRTTPAGVSLLEEVEELRLMNSARRKTKRKFVLSEVGLKERQFSNGENALLFFDSHIKENALYLLDEPENSMSPKFQLILRDFLTDAVRYRNCQLVIATHSPFIMSLKNAKIYNLDAVPVTVEKWHKLENMRAYYDFFKRNKDLFESEW